MHWKPLGALASASVSLGLALAPSAWAGTANRVWVSGHGTDHAGCGAPTAPCRSLQYAHDNAVIAGGEIDILDPAGYGAISITKAISIVNDGVGTAGVQASAGNAININTPAGDTVYLKGLNIDGVQQGGSSGISLTSETNLVVIDCVVRHFNGAGIKLVPSTGFPRILVADTILSDNGQNGLDYETASGNAAAQVVIDHVRVNDNGSEGVLAFVDGSGFLELSVNASAITNNSTLGLSVNGNAVVGVDSSVMEANTSSGAFASFGAILHLSRSALIQNGGAGVTNAAVNSAQVFSTGDNRMFGNNQGATAGPAPVLEATQ